MRVLVIGRGSMGRRRIRDLTALGHDVTSYDALDGPFDVGALSRRHVVISTPPRTKNRYAGLAQYNLSPFFTEADIQQVERIRDGVYVHFPSCTPLFCSDIIRIMESQRPLAYSLHVGQCIDDWHPGADPNTYYAYRDGVREMIPFELIWLTKWLGPVVDQRGMIEPSAAHVVVKHEGGALGEIFIDTLSRPAVRRLVAVGPGWKSEHDIRYSEDAYLAEMRAFVRAIEGGTAWPYTPEQEAANLRVLHAIAPTA